ncbi:MAG: hypothetical protein JRG86_14625, partial [Deltaproteobacteria bacterium]|nr:hypothetical protein [Deltaproteobacteria bacterium]
MIQAGPSARAERGRALRRRRPVALVSAWLAAVACASHPMGAGAEEGLAPVSSCRGEDWSLPGPLMPQRDAGYFTMDV